MATRTITRDIEIAGRGHGQHGWGVLQAVGSGFESPRRLRPNFLVPHQRWIHPGARESAVWHRWLSCAGDEPRSHRVCARRRWFIALHRADPIDHLRYPGPPYAQSSRVLAALKRDGWTETRRRGSHRVLVKDDRQRVWAYHEGVDLGGPAMARIAKDYGYTLDELRKL
ncbi:MAG: type II toxin-antitoxin system HicA family toxin [Pseudonocardiaceae bacterium]